MYVIVISSFFWLVSANFHQQDYHTFLQKSTIVESVIYGKEIVLPSDPKNQMEGQSLEKHAYSFKRSY